MTRTWPPLLWTALWLAVMGTALLTRPPLPVDETRYLAVAWEMWRDGNFLVPHLNGETYSHKPPLLFWLMNLGWGIFGVNDWWPRLVAPLFGLGTLFAVQGLTRKLWPEVPGRPTAAVMILFGCLFWTLFTSLTMFDMMLAFCTAAGLAGLVHAWRTGSHWGFVGLGLGIGLGVLAKGPAILLHTLPVALLAPLWAPRLEGGPPGGTWKQWYLGVLMAVLLGAGIGLAWAVPAGIAGGEDYRNAIFWGQSAGRMVDSFAHNRPWWWYLAVLLPLILPWTLWPPLWRGLKGLPRALSDGGVRFCLAWFLPAFLAFSLISGKQLHYLLPIFPALAMIAALLTEEQESRRHDTVVPALPAFLLGVALLALPLVAKVVTLPEWARSIDALPGVLILLAAGVLILVPVRGWHGRVAMLSGLSAAMVVTIHLAARPVLDKAFDLRPLSERLRIWEQEGYALANYGKYHGQFQFLGRLHKPIAVIGDGEIVDWLKENPEGKIITYQKRLPEGGKPEYIQTFRRNLITVWDSHVARRDRRLVMRPSGTPRQISPPPPLDSTAPKP